MLCETIFHFPDYYFYLFKNLEVFNRFDYTKNLFRKKSFPGNKKIFHVRNHYEIITFETKWKENVWRNIRQLIFWRAMFLFIYFLFFCKTFEHKQKMFCCHPVSQMKKKKSRKRISPICTKNCSPVVKHKHRRENNSDQRQMDCKKKITALGPSGLP